MKTHALTTVSFNNNEAFRKHFYNRAGWSQLLLSMPIYVSFNGPLITLSKYLIIVASRNMGPKTVVK
jgi:hypothetical protein